MNRAWAVGITVVAANLLLLGLLYESVGWHYLRGYREYNRTHVSVAVGALAGINVLALLIVRMICRRRHTSGSGPLTWSLLVVAATILLSPIVAPTVGRYAAEHLWIGTTLVEAAFYGDGELVEILLDHGADPHQRDSHWGYTPLHYMAAHDEPAATEALLEKGADPNAANNTAHETPLHLAMRYRGGPAVISELIQHGADPSAKDEEGHTPAYYLDEFNDDERAAVIHALGGLKTAGISGT